MAVTWRRNLRLTMHHRTWLACLAVVAGCRDHAGDIARTGVDAAPASRVSQEQYRATQARHADSVLAHLRTPDQLVADLGDGYVVGSARLSDSLATLATSATCFQDARRSDPYLAGTVSFLVVMGNSGSDGVRVHGAGTQWTSTAGNIANACLNVAAKDWWFDGRFGPAGRYITQVRFK